MEPELPIAQQGSSPVQLSTASPTQTDASGTIDIGDNSSSAAPVSYPVVRPGQAANMPVAQPSNQTWTSISTTMPNNTTALPEQYPDHIPQQNTHAAMNVTSITEPMPCAVRPESTRSPYQAAGSSMASTSKANTTNPQLLPLSDPHLEPSYSKKDDPELTKLKSSLWRQAGRLQAMLGHISGYQQWSEQGASTQAWADEVYVDAQGREESGQPSRIHGEYNRWMGYIGRAIGHVAGDPEMEAKAMLQTRQGQEEIGRL